MRKEFNYDEFRRIVDDSGYEEAMNYCDILLALKGLPSANFLLRKKRGVPSI